MSSATHSASTFEPAGGVKPTRRALAYGRRESFVCVCTSARSCYREPTTALLARHARNVPSPSGERKEALSQPRATLLPWGRTRRSLAAPRATCPVQAQTGQRHASRNYPFAIARCSAGRTCSDCGLQLRHRASPAGGRSANRLNVGGRDRRCRGNETNAVEASVMRATSDTDRPFAQKAAKRARRIP
jgi:hypothetical protein